MATFILLLILKKYYFFMIFIFSNFYENEKSSKTTEKFNARQNRSVKMTATTNRTISDQHPGAPNPQKIKTIQKTQPKLYTEQFFLRPVSSIMIIQGIYAIPIQVPAKQVELR